jgi:hypothetical protein
MGSEEDSLEPGATSDAVYPTISAPDPVYPCQTLEALGAHLAGIATPAIWSRLEAPLERALGEIWQRLGLLRRCRPQRWVTLHFGRIAVNAHGWERLRALFEGVEPDPALVAPRARGLQGVPELWEQLRVAVCRRQLRARLRGSEVRGERGLSRATARNPSALDAAELARGPLDDPTWTEILLPGLGRRLAGEGVGDADPRLRAAIALEQRHAAELGRRLVGLGVLRTPTDVAYLTVPERIQAVHESSDCWAERISSRRQRVESFVDLDVPPQFWGRPRVEMKKTG